MVISLIWSIIFWQELCYGSVLLGYMVNLFNRLLDKTVGKYPLCSVVTLCSAGADCWPQREYISFDQNPTQPRKPRRLKAGEKLLSTFRGMMSRIHEREEKVNLCNCQDQADLFSLVFGLKQKLIAVTLHNREVLAKVFLASHLYRVRTKDRTV